MSSNGTTSPSLEAAPSLRRRVMRHTCALIIPCITLVFLASTPHAWYGSALFILPLLALAWHERVAGSE